MLRFHSIKCVLAIIKKNRCMNTSNMSDKRSYFLNSIQKTVFVPGGQLEACGVLVHRYKQVSPLVTQKSDRLKYNNCAVSSSSKLVQMCKCKKNVTEREWKREMPWPSTGYLLSVSVLSIVGVQGWIRSWTELGTKGTLIIYVLQPSAVTVL